MRTARGSAASAREGRTSFLKKKQKTFAHRCVGTKAETVSRPIRKSLFASFSSEKEDSF
jgi:hypothetical protein